MSRARGTRFGRQQASALSVCLALLLTGCGGTQKSIEGKASNEEIRQAQEALRVCARKAIPGFDDGVSAAEAVARAVATSCDDSFRRVYRLSTQGWDDPNFLKGFNEAFTPEKVFTPLVLADRARRREVTHPIGR